jgi:hypothetical protein
MTQGRRGGQQRFEDIVLLLPDGEYEYGERGIGTDREREESRGPKL